MLDSTTRLNTPGIALAAMDGVHALTDVTGFGLLGHLLEMCRGAACRAQLEFAPLAAASGRARTCRRRFGHRRVEAQLGELRERRRAGAAIGDRERALLTDPQTSGGLLVACAPEAVDAVLDVFRREGFAAAAPIGRFTAGVPTVTVS